MIPELFYGDLLESGSPVIIHQVNCQGVMGSGIARSIRERYPNVYTEYLSYCSKVQEKSDLLGTILPVEIEPGKYIINLFGQFNFGTDGKRYSSYDAIYEGLTHIREFCESREIKNIAIPYNMCCCRGGADWNVIEAMLKSVFEGTSISVQAWKL